MKENELRIGNLLMLVDTGKTFTVTGIMQDLLGVKVFGITPDGTYCNEWIEHCKPITLTPEWLERLCFKPTEDYFQKISIGKNNTLEFAILHKRTIIFENKKKLFVELKFCEFVHSLMNLYFDLTGKELTLTEPK